MKTLTNYRNEWNDLAHAAKDAALAAMKAHTDGNADADELHRVASKAIAQAHAAEARYHNERMKISREGQL